MFHSSVSQFQTLNNHQSWAIERDRAPFPKLVDTANHRTLGHDDITVHETFT